MMPKNDPSDGFSSVIEEKTGGGVQTEPVLLRTPFLRPLCGLRGYRQCSLSLTVLQRVLLLD